MNNDITNLKYVEVPVVVLLDEDLSSTVNPFTKLTFFSIIKTHLSDTLITTTIN